MGTLLPCWSDVYTPRHERKPLSGPNVPIERDQRPERPPLGLRLPGVIRPVAPTRPQTDARGRPAAPSPSDARSAAREYLAATEHPAAPRMVAVLAGPPRLVARALHLIPGVDVEIRVERVG